MAKRKTCGDCGTKEGQLHILGCDMEGCPFCGNQLISCQCVYKKLGIDVSPGSWAYSHGLTDAQQEDWEKLLSDKRRIPFILYPNLCAKCGALWPEMFLVPNAEWKHYIEPQMRREMLCEACYIQIKAWIDGGLTRRSKQTKRPASRAGGQIRDTSWELNCRCRIDCTRQRCQGSMHSTKSSKKMSKPL